MDLEMLKNYDEWQKKSPGDVLQAVKKVGGWAKVFDQGLPDWAHKVRNYFNHEPLFLLLIEKDRSGALIGAERKNFGFESKMALSGDVYHDESNQNWFQMSPGGTIYHFKEVNHQELEAVVQTARGQGGTPIFKLISPDGTGGSCETIIKNQLRVGKYAYALAGASLPNYWRGFVIANVNQATPVQGLIETNPKFQGSYNYAETIVAGFSAHEEFDIKPHHKNENYVNPPNRFSSLWSRKFPKL